MHFAVDFWKQGEYTQLNWKMEESEMNVSRQRLFSNRKLIKLIIPLIIEQALAVLVGLVDGIMVSAVSEAAMSGVSLVNNVSGIVLNLFIGLATGGAVLTSQHLGAKKRGVARQSAGQLITLSLGVSLVLMVPCLVLSKQILVLTFGNVEQAVMDAAVKYLFYNALSFPFLALYSAGAAIFRSLGNSKISMNVSILTNAINVIGNAICIYGLHMGVEGVAIPTLMSRIVGAVVILIPLFRPGEEFRLRSNNLVKIEGKMMGSILRIGIPTALENSIFQLGRVIVLGMVTPFGTIQTAANATAGDITSFAIIVPTAFRLALITVTGQCFGAHDIDEAKSITKKLLIWCYILGNAVAAVIYLLRFQIIGFYATLSPDTVQLTNMLVSIYIAGAFVMYPLSFVLPGTLRAANDSAFVMMVSVISMLMLRVGLSWVLCTGLGWGVVGVWISMIADWVGRLVCFIIRYYTGGWKKRCYLT